MKKTIFFFLVLSIYSSCNRNKEETSVELIDDIEQQQVLFKKIVNLTDVAIQDSVMNDSIAFLLLPIQSICPSCRKKIIDSIVNNQNNLDDRHFIIISANGGRKTIEAFFRERKHELPIIKNKLFLDSINQAFKDDLYIDKPIFFYANKQKIFKRVSSVPATVKEDLRVFFRS